MASITSYAAVGISFFQNKTLLEYQTKNFNDEFIILRLEETVDTVNNVPIQIYSSSTIDDFDHSIKSSLAFGSENVTFVIDQNDILYRNALGVIEMFTNEFNLNSTYHRLNGGIKQIIDKIIASKITTVETKESTKESIKEDTNIDNVIKQLKDINYKAHIPSINKSINYIIKDCSEDDINKIIFYFKNNSDDMFERQKFILNVLEHKINQFMESTLALLANNKITNKYLKYKKKYLELKKNSNE